MEALSRAEAKDLGLKIYQGKPCPKGHIDRYVSCKNCAICNRDYARQWHKDNPELSKERERQWLATGSNARNKHRKRTLKKYGLTLEDYENLSARQNNVCAICESGGKKGLAVDHCHETGNVRGLLCGRCNTAIGLLREDPSIFTKAVRYICAR